jgi:glycosyltransferase involved in cell wall biosynthesis
MTGIGGSENHLRSLLPALARAGVETRLVILVDPARTSFLEAYTTSLESQGIEVESVPIARHVDPLLVVRLRRVLESFRPELVHTHLVHADLHGTLAARWAGIPVVSSRHNDDPFRQRPLLGLGLRAVNALQSHVIAISRAVADFTERYEGLPASKLTVVRYGLPLGRGRPTRRAEVRAGWGVDDNELLLVTVGRLVEQKGHEYLLQALSRLGPAAPGGRPLRLAIVGDGPLRTSLPRRAEELGLGRQVIFAGFRADVEDVMAAADLYVHPSLWEGFGLVLLEAMAAGRAIVASRVSAVPEVVVDGVTGLLVEPRDPTALAQAIARLLEAPATVSEMGYAGTERLRNAFSVERMIDETLAVYGRVLDRCAS